MGNHDTASTTHDTPTVAEYIGPEGQLVDDKPEGNHFRRFVTDWELVIVDNDTDGSQTR